MLFEEAEHEIRDKYRFVEQQNESVKNINELLTEMIEYHTVLEKANIIIHGDVIRNLNESLHSEGNEVRFSMSGRKSIGADWEEHKEGGRKSFRGSHDNSFREVSIRYMAGTINQDEVERFKRLLFRATRGKVLQFYQEIEAPLKDFNGNFLRKSVYVLAFEEGTHFRDKVGKICDSF